MTLKAKIISLTQPVIDCGECFVTDVQKSPESLIAYCARVSNPNNQENPDYEKLLSYCLKNGHWSIFEMVDMTIEIETSRAISAQILRHVSFRFQEWSTRYSEAMPTYEHFKARRQDLKNRQASHDDLPDPIVVWWDQVQQEHFDKAMEDYKKALEFGIAKECARAILPLQTQTRLYMKGSVRSWLHYLDVRTDKGTQQEHRDVALACLEIFSRAFPVVTLAAKNSGMCLGVAGEV